jgi:hypothetical protein
MARILQFQDFGMFHNPTFGVLLGAGSLHIRGVYVEGSLSFNNVAIPLRVSQTNTATASTAAITMSVGLYSLNGASLSLANSASQSSTYRTTNVASWLTLITSATQDITPGTWYIAVMSSSAGTGTVQHYMNVISPILDIFGSPPGMFVRGYMSVGTNAMPGNIATSDCKKDDETGAGSQTFHHPFVIITA